MAVKKVGATIPKIKNSTVLSYDEMFEKYKKHTKKAYEKTEAFMFLIWQECMTIKDMRRCVFVYPGNDETADYIREYYHVLDENDLNY